MNVKYAVKGIISIRQNARVRTLIHGSMRGVSDDLDWPDNENREGWCN
jgi:hypothetical protein